jgi:hypothetical protein
VRVSPLVLAFTLLGCARELEAPAPVDLGAAKEAVTAFFAAAEAGDCARLSELALRPLPPERCADYVGEYAGGRTHLVEIRSAIPDGRDAHAAIVKVDVSFGNATHHWMKHVVCAPGCRVEL